MTVLVLSHPCEVLDPVQRRRSATLHGLSRRTLTCSQLLRKGRRGLHTMHTRFRSCSLCEHGAADKKRAPCNAHAACHAPSRVPTRIKAWASTARRRIGHANAVAASCARCKLRCAQRNGEEHGAHRAGGPAVEHTSCLASGSGCMLLGSMLRMAHKGWRGWRESRVYSRSCARKQRGRGRGRKRTRPSRHSLKRSRYLLVDEAVTSTKQHVVGTTTLH